MKTFFCQKYHMMKLHVEGNGGVSTPRLVDKVVDFGPPVYFRH